ncbi:hypothetical protein D7B24_004266 [Verticillium nonalfalfae]|uniref:C6 zinc finger domain-containing protein n=1 Tax=Verticillium nonalfalfae TaxID=1051616 RepID=A0A3M9XYH0_9PEZI|nr:uncharacterized protein D7B24_004266 [Verticillium nonalfalfae]RNJ52128.1 hypothetical protein D7B24_004266 [Verticillium nonalfalfae]
MSPSPSAGSATPITPGTPAASRGSSRLGATGAETGPAEADVDMELDLDLEAGGSGPAGSGGGGGGGGGSTGRGAGTPASGTVVSRRSHPKSRTGCRTCKKRKIKTHATSTSAPRSPSSFDFAGNPGNGLSTFTDLNMVDLELIHNFTTFTYATLGSDPQVRQMMKTTVIRMALDCEYIMHTVLAVSALHLSHYRQARADFYVTKAMQHHQVGARVAIALMGGDLHKEDCEHLHLFCLLTLFYALGSPRKSSDDSLLMGQGAFPNWIFLLRSHEPIIERLDPHNYTGPLSPVFALGRERWHVVNRWEQQLPGPPLLGELSALVTKAVTDPDLLHTYSFAIEHLRRVLTLLVANGDSAMGPAVRLEGWDVIMWKWQVAKDFLPLLQGANPAQEAVAIFAHFLILIKKVEDQWWLEGWSTHLMGKVWEKLDQEHRLWVQWPIEELGWVPP